MVRLPGAKQLTQSERRRAIKRDWIKFTYHSFLFPLSKSCIFSMDSIKEEQRKRCVGSPALSGVPINLTRQLFKLAGFSMINTCCSQSPQLGLSKEIVAENGTPFHTFAWFYIMLTVGGEWNSIFPLSAAHFQPAIAGTVTTDWHLPSG